MVHPKYRRYFSRILSFGLIWLVFGLAYSFVEYGIMGRETIYSATGNKYNFQSTLIYSGVGGFLMGLLQGWIEVIWLRKRFEQSPFWLKIIVKGSFYVTLLILFLTFVAIATSMEYLNAGPFDPEVLDSLSRFIRRFSFWSVIIYASLILGLSLFYSEVSEYLGFGVLRNFFIGKYHSPKQEIRIFMFLDMKSSTTIAEKIGHEKYFDLLKDYYSDMTDAILETSGQIYQYVGDEIVISWDKNEGLYKNNCLQCYLKISNAIAENKEKYLEKFGVIPEFKAGYHIGEVTCGEIGILKKDIIYTGDVLNTTARIQGQCNRFFAKVLISNDLMEELQKEDFISYSKIGELILHGKTEPVQLFSISF